MAAAVEHAMEARTTGIDLTPEERFEVFGDHDPERYAEETERRWSGTEAYAESRRRTARRALADWQRMRAESDDLNARYAALVADGVPPAAPAAMDLAEEHRRHIGRWFYECPYPAHRCLGEMYVGDARFTAYYEALGAGVAAHLNAAIAANAERHGAW